MTEEQLWSALEIDFPVPEGNTTAWAMSVIRNEGALWGYRKAMESNTETVQKLAKWIRYKGNEYGGDHACKHCYPYSDVLVDGFVCAYHLACALLATTPGSEE